MTLNQLTDQLYHGLVSIFFVPIKKLVFLDFGGIRYLTIPIFLVIIPILIEYLVFLIKKWSLSISGGIDTL